MDDLTAAQEGDAAAFERLIAGRRRELQVHCYRMLGGVQDAEDAVQETLVAAWRGIGGFQGRSSLRAWLYRIATNVCLRLSESRDRRVLSWDYGAARSPDDDLGEPVIEPFWVDPLIDADPSGAYGSRERIELAYIAALQYLPATQRAVLILRDVLAFSAREVADQLETTPASVNSALQRARATLTLHRPETNQQQERIDAEKRGLIDAFVNAFVAADVPALVRLLTDDVRFTMPPLPVWFNGRKDVIRFYQQRVFATRWRAVRIADVNGQPAVVGYQEHEGSFRLGALMVLSFRGGKIDWIASFLDPVLLAGFDLPDPP